MAVKTTGYEFKRFYNDKNWWKEGTWHDAVVLLVDGEELDNQDEYDYILDSAKVVIDSGVVFLSETTDDGVAMDSYFKRWKKAQTVRSIVVEVDISKLDAVIAAVKAAGGKVI